MLSCYEINYDIGNLKLRFVFNSICAVAGCYVKYFTSTPDIYSDSCPCNAGFTCDGTREFEVPQGEIGTYEISVVLYFVLVYCRRGLQKRLKRDGKTSLLA